MVVQFSILKFLVLAFCLTWSQSIQLKTTPKKVTKCVEVDSNGSNEWDAESELKCPENPLWYHCLQDESGKDEYYEFCRQYIYVSAGTYPTYSRYDDQIHPRDCPEGTYQNARRKSSEINKCNDHVKCDNYGQLICKKGSSTEDSLCKCDYTKGIVIKRFGDNPSTARECCPDEDPSCGCYRKHCDPDEELNEVYQCMPKCPKGEFRPNKDEKCRPLSDVTPADVTLPQSTTVKTTTVKAVTIKNTTSVPKSPDKGSSEITVGVILSIVAAILAFFILIILGIVVSYCCCREKYDSYVETLSNPGIICPSSESEKLRKAEDTTMKYIELQKLVNSKSSQRVGKVSCGKHLGTGFRVGDVYVASAYHLFNEDIDRMLWNVLFQYAKNCEIEKLKKTLAEKLVSDEKSSSTSSQYEAVRGYIEKWKESFSQKFHRGPTFKDLIETGVFEFSDARNTDLHNSAKKEWNADIIFSYTKRHSDNRLTFKLDHNIEFYDKDKDVIILKLVTEEDKEIPPPFILEAGPPVSSMHLFGHPDGDYLQVDIKCKVYTDDIQEQLKKDTRDAMKYCVKKHREWCRDKDCKREDLKKLEKEYLSISNVCDGSVIFHCSESIVHGASGSPGIIIQPDTDLENTNAFKVQAMLQSGLPVTLYKKLYREERKNLRQKVLFEKGILMKTLHEMLSVVPDLRENLFSTSLNADTNYSISDGGSDTKPGVQNDDNESRNLLGKTDKEERVNQPHSINKHVTKIEQLIIVHRAENLAAGKKPKLTVTTSEAGLETVNNNNQLDAEEEEEEEEGESLELLKGPKKPDERDNPNGKKRYRYKDGIRYSDVLQNEESEDFEDEISPKHIEDSVHDVNQSIRQLQKQNYYNDINQGNNNQTSFDILKQNIKRLKYRLRTPLTDSDGNCFFHAISDQLNRLNLPFKNYTTLRKNVVHFLRNLPQTQVENLCLKDFVEGKSSNKEQRWEDYLTNMSCDGTYADEIIVKHMAEMLNQTIIVVTSSPGATENDQLMKLYNQKSPSNDQPLLVGHIHEHHYVSLEPDTE